MAPSNSFQLDVLRRQLKPFRLHWFPRLRSTSDHAAELRRRGSLFAPALVLSGHQIAGRGRGSNRWWSGRGSITVTFVFPVEDHLAPHQVPLIAGLAVREAAAELTGDDSIALKWPNDVLYNGRKLAGLLCERMDKVDLIGLGLNVNLDPRQAPAALRERITSLGAISGKPQDLSAALLTVARRLRARLVWRDEPPFGVLLREYDQHHALRGKRVTVVTADGPVTGRCEGLDASGRLLLRDRRKLHHVIAGEVHEIGR